MTGDFTALYLDEREFRSAIEINKKFEPSYKPYLVIRILQHHNEESFKGLICRGITFSREDCITKYNRRIDTLLIEYEEKKEGAFTFDGIRFFRILNLMQQSTTEGLIIFTFKYINIPTFTEKNTAFMVMPFKFVELNKFYQQSIKLFLKECDLKITVCRADDFTGTDVIADTILEQIRRAEFIICDITNCNKNVFFEIGYAKGLNKDMIFLLEQNMPVEFFDVNHIRRIEYGYNQVDYFQNLLRETLISVRNSRL